jgi:hypothetical protein
MLPQKVRIVAKDAGGHPVERAEEDGIAVKEKDCQATRGVSSASGRGS